MKKITSIILLITIIFSCFALASCSLDGIISFITGNEKEVVFEHSDNFTEDDIEFVKMLHGKLLWNDKKNSTESYMLCDIIELAEQAFPVYLMHFDNPYIIVAYHKPNCPYFVYDDKTGNANLDVTYFVWHKFNTTDEIPDTIDDTTKTDYAYLLYDCTIEKDISNDIEYNKECKYYLDYYGERTLRQVTEYMMMYFLGNNIAQSNSQFISQCAAETTRYPIITVDDKKYIKILNKIYPIEEDTINVFEEDYGKSALGDYYDILEPDLACFDEWNIVFEYEGKHYLEQHTFIDIEILEKIIMEGR